MQNFVPLPQPSYDHECENCKSIKAGSFIDIIEIDGASNRKIEDARELREQIKFPPLKGKKKVIGHQFITIKPLNEHGSLVF